MSGLELSVTAILNGFGGKSKFRKEWQDVSNQQRHLRRRRRIDHFLRPGGSTEIGFSTSVGLPAFSDSITTSKCLSVGRQTSTNKIPGLQEADGNRNNISTQTRRLTAGRTKALDRSPVAASFFWSRVAMAVTTGVLFQISSTLEVRVAHEANANDSNPDHMLPLIEVAQPETGRFTLSALQTANSYDH